MRKIIWIKQKLKNNRFIRPLYLRYWYIKQRCLEAESFQKLQTDGYKVIEFIQNALGNVVFFYFDAGTLLGIVREGRLLKHDNDIDIAVKAYEKEEIEKTRKALLKAGCKAVHTFSIEGIGTVEDAFEIYGFRFDVFYIMQGTPKDYVYLMYKGMETQGIDTKWNVSRLYFTPVTQLKKINFQGMLVNVPEGVEMYLEERYGDWRTPNKYFDHLASPNTEITNLISTSISFGKEKRM